MMKSITITIVALMSMSTLAMEPDSVAFNRHEWPDSAIVYEKSGILENAVVATVDSITENTSTIMQVDEVPVTSTDVVSDSTLTESCEIDSINYLIDKVNMNRANLQNMKLKEFQQSAINELLDSYDSLVQALNQREKNNQLKFENQQEKSAWLLGFLSDDETVYDIEISEGQNVPVVLESFYQYLSKIHEINNEMHEASRILQSTVDFVKQNISDEKDLKAKVCYHLKNTEFIKHASIVYEEVTELKRLEQPLSDKQQAYFQKIRDRFNQELFDYYKELKSNIAQ